MVSAILCYLLFPLNELISFKLWKQIAYLESFLRFYVGSSSVLIILYGFVFLPLMWDEQVYFLHEFCSLSKSLQMVQQLRLFRYVTLAWLIMRVPVLLFWLSILKKLVLFLFPPLILEECGRFKWKSFFFSLLYCIWWHAQLELFN